MNQHKTFLMIPRMSIRFRRLILWILVMVFSQDLMAAPGIPGTGAGLPAETHLSFRGPDFDVIGRYRVYRMETYTDNSCQVYYTPIPVDIEYDVRDPSITDYQATSSITFGAGFQTADGDAFTAEIVPGTVGVPQATNQTGTADANINWIQTTAYDETGAVIADNKQFYDDNGRNEQTQRKVFYRAGASTLYTHVMANQTIRDAYGRNAATTLSAPIDYADFSYRPGFLQHNSSGTVYNHQNFDLSVGGDKTTNPDPLWDAGSGTPVRGTLAWYYSKYNNWEPFTSETSYPYSRQTWYLDGTGNVKKSATPGDVLHMGQGREQSNCITPVANELDFYLQVRNKFFATTEVGGLPVSLQNQAMQTIAHDANGTESIVIQDRSGKTLMIAHAGTGITVANTVTVSPSGSGDMNIWYFKLLSASTVNISGGTYTLYDMNTELTYSFTSGGTLPAGYYKVVNTGTGTLTVNYSNSYSDVSYCFYDQKGQSLATIAPEGVKKLYGANGAGLANYATRGDIPFITQFTYDLLGRMISSGDKDGGNHLFIYRKDGKLRFSQNALQAANGSFSYINYDQLGRVIETGQYQSGNVSFNTPGMTAILETTSPDGGLATGTRTDVMLTQFDLPDQSHPLSNYTQDAFNLAGSISLTKKYSTIVNNSPSATNLVSATWYNYDEEKKITWRIRYISGLGTSTTDPNSYKTVDYVYDIMGNLTRYTFQSGKPDAFAHVYDYDPVNKQLWHVSTIAGNGNPVLQATYYYNLNSSIRRIELAGNLQGVDYAYTLQGTIKAINNSNKGLDPGGDGGSSGFSADAFGEVLDYYTGDYVNTKPQVAAIKGIDASAITTDSYAGNIKAMSWYSEKPATSGAGDAPTAYVYKYDPKYQFTESTWGNIGSFSGTLATFGATGNNKERVGDPTNGVAPYDGNGNIQYLQRTDANGAVIDQFTYNYTPNSNQLASVTTVVAGIPQTYATYTYDARGQATSEVTSGGTQKYMTYDLAGKVTGVYRQTGNSQPVIGLVYDEAGQRIKKLKYNNSGLLIEVDYYVEGVIYTQPVSNGTLETATALEYQIKAPNRIGVWYAQNNVYAYEMDDHLGNARAIIARSGSTYEVRMYTDYYPYGMTISPPNGTNDYRYGYQGQNAEMDPETNWNAFELRMYNSRIGRWLQYDPQGQFYSPYVGMGNNPVSGTDKDGGLWVPDADGNLVAEKGDNINTLMDFLGVDYDEAASVFYNQKNWSGGSPVDGNITGNTLKLDNVYTQSIQFSKNNPQLFLSDDQLGSMTKAQFSQFKIDNFPNNLYNCWGSAVAGSSGNVPGPGTGIPTGLEYDSYLQSDFDAIPNGDDPENSAQFGNTVLRFGTFRTNQFQGLSVDVQHGAVFYGQSQDGTVYVYTKNGWYVKPVVMKLDDLLVQIPSYGVVIGMAMDGSQSGWYTHK